MAKTHALQQILETGATPVAKAVIKTVPHADAMVGQLLAAEVLAHAKGQDNIWRVFAMRIISLNIEARSAFVAAIKADKGAMTKAQTEHGIDAKKAKQRTASFAVQVSELQTIANAWNAGATVTGWREYVNSTVGAKNDIRTDAEMLEHGGYRTLVEYARTFSQSKAGRKPDIFQVKLGKFLEACAKAGISDEDLPVYNKTVEFFNNLK
jgi:hypothetical protein